MDFWVMMLYTNLAGSYQGFAGTFRVHLHRRKDSILKMDAKVSSERFVTAYKAIQRHKLQGRETLESGGSEFSDLTGKWWIN
jgi:hypothetical protein